MVSQYLAKLLTHYVNCPVLFVGFHGLTFIAEQPCFLGIEPILFVILKIYRVVARVVLRIFLYKTRGNYYGY